MEKKYRWANKNYWRVRKKSIYYKLKKWEKNLLKYLKKLLFLDLKMKEHIDIMENEKMKCEEKIEFENKKYEMLSNETMEEKIKLLNQ